MEDKEKSIQDKVDEITTTTFSIAGCPIKVFKLFVKFCEENAKTTKIIYNEGKREIREQLCYAIGLKQLVDIANADAKSQMLFDRVVKLEERMVVLEDTPPKPEKKEIKTMGRH